MLNEKEINNLLETLTLDDMIGQMLCYHYSKKYSEEDVEEIIKNTKAGSFFISNLDPEKIKKCTNYMNKHTKIPGR